MVGIVFQHAASYNTEGHYSAGEIIGKSGASANGSDYGGDVHLHIHGVNSAGQRVDFTKFIDGNTTTPPQKEDDMVRLIRIPINGQNEAGGWHWLVVDHGNHSYWHVPNTPMVTLLRNQGMVEVAGLQPPSIIDGYRNITVL